MQSKHQTFNISKTSVVNAKRKLNIKSRKKITGPKYVKERAEKSLRRLYKLSVPSGGEKFFIMDDVDPSQLDVKVI